MIGLFEVGGLFLMIAATLRFTTWAEGWLSVDKRTTADVSLSTADPSAPKRETARAA